MSDRLPSHAQTVVIGGGVVGCSIAYHLAKMGHTDVVLLEKSALSAGTTWHSAGNMETYRADPLLFQIVRYGVSLFPELEKESGQALGWRTTGRVMYTHLPDRMEAYKTVPGLAEVRDIEVELLDAKRLKQHFPILDTSSILGGLWIPEDGRVNPTDLTTAFARAAKKRGAKILENCSVKGINTANGRITGVQTAEGEIKCENVVVAAGLWSSDITATCGVQLPLYALEHLYLITKEIPEVPRDLPMFLAFDDYLYGREEVGGLIVGCLDKNAIPIATRDLPVDFSFGLLNEQWDQFEPYMSIALERFPVLEKAEIRMLLNGPESFTPDSQMLLGPIPSVEGLLVAAGMNSNGIALSSGVGLLISQWIVEGRPDMDVSRLDVRRFSRCQGTEFFMRERATEIPSYCISMHGPGDDHATSRNIRHSPLHHHLLQKGGHFKSICGWERALWVNVTQGEENPGSLVDDEIAASENNLLAVDRSSDVKFLLEGTGAENTIAALAGKVTPPDVGEAVLVPVLNDKGFILAVVNLFHASEGRWLITASAEQETSVRNVISQFTSGRSDVTVQDVSGTFALIRLIGPGRQALLDGLFSPLVQSRRAGDFPANGLIGASPVAVWNDTTAPSSFILIPAEMALSVAMLMDKNPDIFWGGFFADEAHRVRNNVPAYGRELSYFTDVPLSDFPCFADLPKGKNQTEKGEHSFTGTIDCDLGIGTELETILSAGKPVGWLTSCAWIKSSGKSILIGRIADGHLEDELQLLIGDERLLISRL